MTKQSEPAPEIEFRNVSIKFGSKPALNNISFRLERDEMIFLTGVAASGKSVLLHLAIGLLKPDAGEILIDGQNVTDFDEEQLLEVRGHSMGMVFQEDALFSGMSVFDNVAYRLSERGWDEKKIADAVGEVLKFVGLEGEEEKFPDELSGGMKRRVEIARALIGWPPIMLFDEPTMGLDPIVASQVNELIMRARDLNQESSIYVTKRLYELPFLSQYRVKHDANGELTLYRPPVDQLPKTRVLVLKAGNIIFDGGLDEFFASKTVSIRELLEFDNHDHSQDEYFADPWDKRRKPKEGSI